MSQPTQSHFLLVLDNDPIASKYICPLSTCAYESSSGSSILSHNKSCSGSNSPSLTLFPRLFSNPQFQHYTLPTFSAQYPDYDWKRIQQYINQSPPNILTLIQQFNMFITDDFLKKYRSIVIPHSLQHFVLKTNFDPRHLHSILEPPHKKRKLSHNGSTSFDINHTCASRRRIAPICGACNTELNPCNTMIQCAECEHSVIICIMCFKMGREFEEHKRFHAYNVLRPLYEFKLQNNHNTDSYSLSQKSKINRYKLTHGRWKAMDEWNLFCGLRRYGLGNWTEIAKIINKGDSDSKHKHFDYKHVESHFHLKYGDTVHLEQTEEKENEKHKPKASSVSFTRRNNKKNRKYNNEWIKRSESKFTEKHKLKCGYRELRDEFEAEWNNDAEGMIGDMYFSRYDTQNERALKLEGIRLYNNVLQQRKRRRTFIKQYGVQYQRKNRHKRNMTQEDMRLEDEISNNLAMFARYTQDKNHNFAEFRTLVQGLMHEKKLREKIGKYKHYLLNGITSIDKMEEIEKYVQSKDEEEDDDDDIAYNNCNVKRNKREKKLCDILAVSPTDYRYIEQQIAKRVRVHGLLCENKIAQPLYIDIDDVQDVSNTMTMRIGLVDARVLC